MHVTFNLDKTDLICTGHNCTIGIETNPDGLALTIIDNKGNYKWHHYLKTPELLTARGNRRTNLCGELVKEAILIAQTYCSAIAAEDLKFIKDRHVHNGDAMVIARRSYKFKGWHVNSCHFG